MRNLLIVATLTSFLLLTACGQNSVPNATVQPAQATVQIPQTKDIESLVIASDGAGSADMVPNNPSLIMAQVDEWLNSAQPVSVQLPQLKTKQQSVSGGYTGPSTLIIKLNDKDTTTVIPAYFIWSNSRGGYDYHYLDGVIGYETWQGWSYFKAPALYKWLKDDQWRQQFTNKVS